LFSKSWNFAGIEMLAAIAVMTGFCAPAEAQRARFPDFFQVQGNEPIFNSPNMQGSPSIITAPPQQLPATLPPSWQPPPNAGFAQPSFNGNFSPPLDPFQSPTQPFPVFPAPQQIAPQPQFGNPRYFNQPQYQGTNSSWLPELDWSRPEQMWRSFRQDFLPRLMERPRVRHTYLANSSGSELGIHDLELTSTVAIPNFINSNQPLRISPGFIFHFWDGPDSVVHPGFDLPAQAYSSYLAFDHLTNPANRFGLETNFTIGYYSDFKNNSSDAIRLTGRLLGWQRLNAYTVGKFGVEYFDRVNVKLLPAFGVYMTPTPDIKLDLFFPRSKLSHRLPNFNDFEAWAYVGGEYGGGSWAIERTGGAKDQADINDVRAFLGVEWMGPRRITGFLEAGYVFERELLYRSDPLNGLDLHDTVMIRSGLAF